MSILTQLKTLNITPDQLSNLNKTGIIRIEKRLKAEVKFNENLTINEVEEVIDLLKNNKSELEFIYTDYFIFFRQIIENPNELITFNTNTTNGLEFSEGFIDFTSTYFENQLELYVINCNKEMHYYALYSLLNYKDILSESLLDYILESLRKKIKIGFETLRLKPKGPYDKLDYVINPYFYRCVTKIAPLAVENDVIDLMNTIINNKFKNDYQYKALFAFGDFTSSRADTAEVIAENKRVAIKKGVCERYYAKDDFPKKGGTVIKSNKKTHTSSSNSYSNNSSDSSYSSSASFNEREKNRSSFGPSLIFKIMIGIVILYKALGIILPLWYSHQPIDYSEKPYEVELPEESKTTDFEYEDTSIVIENEEDLPSEELEEFEYSLETVIIPSKNKKKPVLNYLKFTNSLPLVEKNFSTVYNSIQFFQSSRVEILKEISTDFEMKGTHFENPNYPRDSKSKVVIENQNPNNIIALIKTKVGCVIKFIPSREKCIVRQRVEGITLYVGNNPQIITCLTLDGEIIKGFRFANWSLENQQVFYRYTYVNQIKNQKLNLIITDNEYRLLKK